MTRKTPLNPSEQLAAALRRVAELEAGAAFAAAGARSNVLHLAAEARLRAEIDPFTGKVTTGAISEDGARKIALGELVDEYKCDIPAVFGIGEPERRPAAPSVPTVTQDEWTRKVATAPREERAALLRAKAAGAVVVVASGGQ